MRLLSSLVCARRQNIIFAIRQCSHCASRCLFKYEGRFWHPPHCRRRSSQIYATHTHSVYDESSWWRIIYVYTNIKRPHVELHICKQNMSEHQVIAFTRHALLCTAPQNRPPGKAQFLNCLLRLAPLWLILWVFSSLLYLTYVKKSLYVSFSISIHFSIIALSSAHKKIAKE
jgi:hypothetical protein